jgi:hypothetical protein
MFVLVICPNNGNEREIFTPQGGHNCKNRKTKTGKRHRETPAQMPEIAASFHYFLVLSHIICLFDISAANVRKKIYISNSFFSTSK